MSIQDTVPQEQQLLHLQIPQQIYPVITASFRWSITCYFLIAIGILCSGFWLMITLIVSPQMIPGVTEDTAVGVIILGIAACIGVQFIREKTKQDVQEVLFCEDGIRYRKKDANKLLCTYDQISSYSFDSIFHKSESYDVLLLELNNKVGHDKFKFIPLERAQVVKVDHILCSKKVPQEDWVAAEVTALKNISQKKRTQSNGQVLYAWEQPPLFATHKLLLGGKIVLGGIGVTFLVSFVVTMWGIHLTLGVAAAIFSLYVFVHLTTLPTTIENVTMYKNEFKTLAPYIDTVTYREIDYYGYESFTKENTNLKTLVLFLKEGGHIVVGINERDEERIDNVLQEKNIEKRAIDFDVSEYLKKRHDEFIAEVKAQA
ncbi:hypothetical protein [Candidatus Uabimicrobium amorphum]|uniref:Uncharacterized protein n=1 Tax=Uabimicrobium amorphum TaxID=2596890 RepID=A0A5S9ILW8_UABAM|nr:hypothetical protein [Candidatus Uabimicrobium amorphum]BBM83752.1 hypothetical protein UABAM_02106 [Candidatus Uabimicrobium amorphum]